MLGTCSSTPLKPPHERGKSSYQEPKRASVRSTSISRCSGSSVASLRSWTRLDELEQRGVERGVRIGGDRLGGRGQAALVLALGAVGRGAQQDGALAELAAEVGLAELDLARQLVAPAGEEVDPRLDVPLRAPGLLDGEGPLPAHAVVVGVDRDQRRLAPALVPGLAPAHDGAQHLVAIAEDVRRHLHRVGHGALDWPSTAVDGRRRVRDPDAARRFGLGAGGHEHPSFPHATSTNQRCATASDLASGREAWRTGAAVRRLARGGGPVVVAGAAARAAQSPGLSVQGIVGFRCMARVPGRSATRRSRRPSATRSASATGSGSTTGRPSPAARGPSTTRSASTASGLHCACTPTSAACA